MWQAMSCTFFNVIVVRVQHKLHLYYQVCQPKSGFCSVVWKNHCSWRANIRGFCWKPLPTTLHTREPLNNHLFNMNQNCSDYITNEITSWLITKMLTTHKHWHAQIKWFNTMCYKCVTIIWQLITNFSFTCIGQLFFVSNFCYVLWTILWYKQLENHQVHTLFCVLPLSQVSASSFFA